MSSFSDCDDVLVVENLSLVFDTDVFQSWTWRDWFVRSCRDPWSNFARQAPGRLPLLKNISLRVRRGERVGILGVNGTGKTSLCRCIAGVYTPNRGKIHVRGKVRAVFDTSVGILPELTGRENAELLVQFLFPDDFAVHDEILEDALGFSELKDFLDVPYRLYSNGMQARLCLSLISSRPSGLLILDEVFDGADTFFREKISGRVVDMIRESEALLFVSHSFEQIREVCNRVIVLHQGGIDFDGAVEDGIAHYCVLGGRLPERLGKTLHSADDA